MKNVNNLLLALYFSFLLCVLLSCNSVKKTTASKEVRVDSVVSSVTDSSASVAKKVQLDSTTFKIWDKETVIEFANNMPVYRIEGPGLSISYDSILTLYNKEIDYIDGEIVVKNLAGVKKITIRSKGKDSTSLKKNEDSTAQTLLTKNVQTELSKVDKSKESNKESDRFGFPWVLIFIGLGLIAAIYLFFKK